MPCVRASGHSRYRTVTLDPTMLEDSTHGWHRLDPWPDAVEGQTRLSARFPIGTLSIDNMARMLGIARRGKLAWDAILGTGGDPGLHVCAGGVSGDRGDPEHRPRRAVPCRGASQRPRRRASRGPAHGLCRQAYGLWWRAGTRLVGRPGPLALRLQCRETCGQAVIDVDLRHVGSPMLRGGTLPTKGERDRREAGQIDQPGL